MSAAWTPGPWRLDPEANDEAVIGSRGFLVADCCIFSARKGAPTDAENRANARLIAAAPDLAEALEKLVDARDAVGAHETSGPALDMIDETGRPFASPQSYQDYHARSGDLHRALGAAFDGARAALSKARGETE